ncbi:hypothetical protein [Bacillus phage vB_BtM_BMBsp2]|nr:hypothetical protein [Bacillus phage vB_BtM_BMBsp2]
MGWRQKLNTQGIIIDEDVDVYLKGEGFYESTMNPRFLDDWSFVDKIECHGVPCLRLDTDDPHARDYTMRIFVSATELYMEVQTSYGSLDRSYHVAAPDGVTMETIDELMDELIGY